MRGEAELLRACRRCYASLFTDRAIVYRETNGFDHLQVALSIGIQRMVRADLAGSGVMFTLDTETGFPRVIVINAAWGLGENVVQGTVNPDKYVIFKPLLTDERRCPIIEKSLGTKEKKLVYGQGSSARTRNLNTTRRERETMVLSDVEILQLARWAVAVEKHYGQPMDMEWAKDGDTSQLFWCRRARRRCSPPGQPHRSKPTAWLKKASRSLTRCRHWRGHLNRQRLPDLTAPRTSIGSARARSWSPNPPTRIGCRS